MMWTWPVAWRCSNCAWVPTVSDLLATRVETTSSRSQVIRMSVPVTTTCPVKVVKVFVSVLYALR